MGKTAVVAAVAVLAATAFAGCGSSGGKQASGNGYSSAKPAANTTTGGASASAVALSTKQNGKLGKIVAGENGKTIYIFEADKNGKSACSGKCATAWPPVTTSGALKVSGGVDKGQIGTIKRADGTKQITYNGQPLYYYASDGDAGDAYGQAISSFGADWYTLDASGNKVEGNAASSNKVGGDGY